MRLLVKTLLTLDMPKCPFLCLNAVQQQPTSNKQHYRVQATRIAEPPSASALKNRQPLNAIMEGYRRTRRQLAHPESVILPCSFFCLFLVETFCKRPLAHSFLLFKRV
jgi:hypothetical protein